MNRAMVIRRRDAEADADADAEMQMVIDFEAGGSSEKAAQKQLRSIRHMGDAGKEAK